jgi:preprotein translocase subunit SecA
MTAMRDLQEGRGDLTTPGDAGAIAAPSRPAPRTATGEKVGRNDPCPCGSGKKYKKCHYLQGK